MHHSIDHQLDKPQRRRVVNLLLSDVAHINIFLVTIEVCNLLAIPEVCFFILDDDTKGRAQEVCKALSHLRMGGEEHLLEDVLLLSDPFDEPDTCQGVRLVHRY
jgi:hypothetical protein